MTSRIRFSLSQALGTAALALASAVVWLAVPQQAAAQQGVAPRLRA